MFRKLRIKFVAIVMTSVAIVLAIVFTGICITEYQHSTASVDKAMTSAIDRAAEAEERMRDPFGFERMHSEMMENLFGSESDTDNDDDSEEASENDSSDASIKQNDNHSGRGFNRPRIGGHEDDQRTMVPVAVYTLSTTNSFIIAQGFTTASIDNDVLQQAAERLCVLEDGQGTFSDLALHYLKRTVDDTTFVAFADTSTTDSWKSLAITLGIAGLGTLAVFFIIALLLSKWALRPVREAWDAQRQFVADASHDLKTPLTVILANASILLKHPEHSIASESQWIESTQIEAKHMQGLINEMLELAQVEAGEQVNVVRDTLDFSDLVDGETLLFDSVALERGCHFDCDIASGLTVEGNEQQLHKMVSTLVENAFKYVDEAGTINVTLRQSGKFARLDVCNTGSTISPEDLPHIFDRFYRTDKARTSGAGGFGLGLAIAREIARSHGGDITCASSPDAGTTFSVSLPVARPGK